MRTITRNWAVFLLTAAAGVLALAGTSLQAKSPDLLTLTVVVTDAASGKPVNQAQLTLTFTELLNGPLHRGKTLSYTAKTDARGRGRFLYVPAGEVRLFVSHPHHQSFGKLFTVSREHSTLEVRLKPPQPIL